MSTAMPSTSSLKRNLGQMVRRMSRIRPRLLSLAWYPLVFDLFGRAAVMERPTLLAFPDCIRVGPRAHIRRGVRLEAVPRPGQQPPRIEIGADVLIEQNVQIIATTRVVLGDRVAIAGHCAIVDATHPFGDGDGNIGHRLTDDGREVSIGAGTFVGFGAVILPGVHLGEGCVVGANAVVTRSFGARSVIAGAPARLLQTY